MDNVKKIIITVLIIAVIVYSVIVFDMGRVSYPSISEQADLLRECDYDLDYEAIESFADAWDNYIEELNTEYEYRNDCDY